MLACGGTVVSRRRPEPGAIAAAIRQERPTILGAHRQLVKGTVAALDAADGDAASLRVVVYGSGALRPRS